MNDFRLDRTAFKIQTFEEADNQRAYWMSKTPKERLAAAWYLICAAYGLDYEAENRMDRTYFRIRKRDE
jgi:hypothetical protein